ncbi:outer membrane protein assembly factor BamC [Bathymodiolus platifrons methanotrophic gill symbiont]|uniref:outer membrane protein assembly factor BamC n=1 Tax=Bathymodiolus platifrons methanotrophic gill symbiont TaxID=113268 RepID=UPI000B41E6DF|nr:outer membrane protein assembly factor BamC [Bathymodiolus platifrons methanotrophic gill symbiont]MCK5870429.1 outer membrane protein assembly factor BamC [Methyloprofundus sp.]TXK97986.1 outer membrane protein assembly factor BamC [Methylococcaceae bacterium CS4]TXL00250.1 outer membrane protein assembly factor BamC [Methylococcaceae bacterium CS5]TXL05881.1 outer membrane protein assembly factor BamC [Methylococcaceae bacterium CS1]TXL07086.1 outer membrane protein assembly factor BamC [
MKPIKVIFIFSVAFLTACGKFFPDKEADYIYSKEIPQLKIPPEMQAERLQAESEEVIVPVTLSKTVQFIDQGENKTYVRINSPFAHVWRIVGKALTARAVEITDKNRSLATYYVQYDPELQAVSDGTFGDEFVFFFSGDANQDIPYQVYLTESEFGTDIFVRDQLGNKLSNGDGLKLLNLLFDTIKQDFES